MTRQQLFDLAEHKYRVPVSEYRQFHRNAIEAGILEQVTDDDETELYFPISSLLTYMQCNRKEIDFNKKMRQQMDAHSNLWSESKGLEL